MFVVKDAFLTLQGEGVQAGRRAVFIRFAGCNLWSGLERDRARAICQFCDTDFRGADAGRFGPQGLADHAADLWGPGHAERFVVLTGGEPLLQVNAALLDALRAGGFQIAAETNGTRVAPPGIDWLCVSPKAGARTVQRTGDELKLVWPQRGIDPAAFLSWDFAHYLLQPMDGRPGATEACVAYVLAHPEWRLSLQTHKVLGLR